MLDSVLLLLSAAAGILLVPAFVALLGVEKHRHLAQSQERSRRARVAAAATLVGLGALGIAAALGADAVPALAVAVVLSVSVLVWSPLSSSWAVRGVAVWALLVTGVLAFLGWLLQQIWVSSMSAGERIASVAGWLLLLLAVSRLQHYVRPVIGAQAGLVPGAAVAQQIPTLRPVLSLAALLAAIGLFVAVTAEDTGPADEGQSPEAGLTAGSQTIAGTSSIRPSSAATGSRTPNGARSKKPGGTSAEVTRTQGPGAATAGGDAAGGVGVNVVAGASAVRPGSVVAPGASCPTTGPAKAPDGRAEGGKVRPGSGTGSDGDGTKTAVPSSEGPSQSPAQTPATGEGTAAPTTTSPQPADSRGPAWAPPPRSPEPVPGLVRNPHAKPSPVVTAIGRSLGHHNAESHWPSSAKTLGAGVGRGGPPAAFPGRTKTFVPSERVSLWVKPDPIEPVDDKTYGYEKEKPNRPWGAPSPGHGRPSAS